MQYLFLLFVDHPTMFHLCGDNKGIKPRYMRVGTSKPESIHHFHSYAVADWIDFTTLSDHVIPTLQLNAKQVALSLLPTPEEDLALRENAYSSPQSYMKICDSSSSVLMVWLIGTSSTTSMMKCQQSLKCLLLTLSLARTDISVLGSELFQKIVKNWSFEL